MLRLSDEQWERIRDHFPEEHIPEGRPGRKPIPTRAVLEAVLWILNTGAQWHMLPQCYPNSKTLRDEGSVEERESFIDATFGAAEGGGGAVGLTKRGKGVKILAIVDRHGL